MGGCQMSVQLLDKTRKINKLLHNNNSSKVVFNDICDVLKDILNSNILVISKKGKVLGTGLTDGYCQIREAGRPFEKLKSVIEAYHPDFIFIFNWEERDDVFEGMDFEWQKVYYKDKLQAVYTLPGYSTKVIWTSHPRRYSYLGTNIEEMAGSLADTFAAIR